MINNETSFFFICKRKNEGVDLNFNLVGKSQFDRFVSKLIDVTDTDFIWTMDITAVCFLPNMW